MALSYTSRSRSVWMWRFSCDVFAACFLSMVGPLVTTFAGCAVVVDDGGGFFRAAAVAGEGEYCMAVWAWGFWATAAGGRGATKREGLGATRIASFLGTDLLEPVTGNFFLAILTEVGFLATACFSPFAERFVASAFVLEMEAGAALDDKAGVAPGGRFLVMVGAAGFLLTSDTFILEDAVALLFKGDVLCLEFVAPVAVVATDFFLAGTSSVDFDLAARDRFFVAVVVVVFFVVDTAAGLAGANNLFGSECVDGLGNSNVYST